MINDTIERKILSKCRKGENININDFPDPDVVLMYINCNFVHRYSFFINEDCEFVPYIKK